MKIGKMAVLLLTAAAVLSLAACSPGEKEISSKVTETAESGKEITI